MDVYIALDPSRDPEEMIVAISGRFQGAVLAAIDYAQKRAPIEFPLAMDVPSVIQKINQRVVIINKDVLDLD